jgi:hypothetical protein
MVVQDIVLQEPIIRRCKDCEKKDIKDDSIQEDSDVEYFEGK